MNKSENNVIRIEIFGSTYTLKTDASEEYVKKIAAYINNRLNEIAEKGQDLPTFKIAILGLIEIMDDLLKTREKLSKIEGEFGAKTSELIQKIDKRLSSEYSIM
ncbi:MAG: cell division protein ZapA [Spirochaetes bacterium]|nr:cell division protein ZapA [Spirochaetota bacterium]